DRAGDRRVDDREQPRRPEPAPRRRPSALDVVVEAIARGPVRHLAGPPGDVQAPRAGRGEEHAEDQPVAQRPAALDERADEDGDPDDDHRHREERSGCAADLVRRGHMSLPQLTGATAYPAAAAAGSKWPGSKWTSPGSYSASWATKGSGIGTFLVEVRSGPWRRR